ncbi:MAG: HDOD domain-containing protein [Candidatus Caenarcaniphilales bacterium]|nr:HDOD domain-containing protein [Candidatus Caenarcaniphilales bacterium]
MNPTTKDATLFLGRSAELEAKLGKLLEKANQFNTEQSKILEIINRVNDFNSLKAELTESVIKVENLAKKLIHKTKNKQQLKKLPSANEKDLTKTIQILGYDIVSQEAENYLVSEFLELANQVKNRDLKKLIKNSAWTALIAKGIAEMLDYPELSDAFFAGFNYNIATILIGLGDNRSYGEIKQMTNKGMDTISSTEAIFGFSPSEIAKRFLLNNKFNESVVDVVCYGHEHRNKEENKVLAHIVHYANAIVHSINEDKKSIAEIWGASRSHFDDLNLKANFNDWSREIKLIFFKLIKLENEV